VRPFTGMRVSRLLSVTLCAALACATGLCAQAPQEMAHKAAPEFVRTDLAGRRIDLKDYRGKVVLLNFWATWCAGCQIELPKFAMWQKEYGAAGLQIVGVSMDDSAAPVRRTVRRLNLDFPVVMGDARLGDAYGGVLGLPVTYLIDRDGRIEAQIKGEADLAALESRVKRLLAQ
jgi:cytochrome c biogenesis protein CcmG/thiol:disulfide interchange protein DsbE